MPIKIRIGKGADDAFVRLEMDIRKSMSGDLMIFDHADVDIVLSTAKNKIIAFPKDTMSDLVYGAQNRLFTELQKKGIIVADSIQAGSFYGSIEATMQETISEDLSAPKMALINISRFIDEERPYFESTEAIISMKDDELLHPDKTDSTELGEVPQAANQGSMQQNYIRDPYSVSYMYTFEQETLMELLTFILCAYGLTQILVYGKVFSKLRPKKGKLGELANCPMCMGFHVGWLLMLLSPFTELFSFDVTVFNFFLLGGISSGTSYILTMLFGDDGVKHEHKLDQ